MDKYIVLDTETGGTDPSVHSLLQIGLTLIEGEKIKSTDVIQVTEPIIHVTQEAMSINRINLVEQVGVSPERAMEVLIWWLTRNGFRKGDRAVLIGHNVKFDVTFLLRLFKMTGYEKDFYKWFSYRTIDTSAVASFMNIAGTIDLKGRSASLESLCEWAGIAYDSVQAHDAGYDSNVTAQLFLHLLHKERT